MATGQKARQEAGPADKQARTISGNRRGAADKRRMRTCVAEAVLRDVWLAAGRGADVGCRDQGGKGAGSGAARKQAGSSARRHLFATNPAHKNSHCVS